MEEELQKKISEEQRDQLIGRICSLYDEGVLRIRDWMAMYDLMLEACERERSETLETMITERINAEGEEK